MIIVEPTKDLSVSVEPQSGILVSSFAEYYPLTILIAEDDFINQKLIENILRRLGYRTHAVSDGVQVLDMLKKKNFNAILMDICMPEMGGYETTQAIRKMKIKQPYIIAMTANAMANDKDKCLNFGMNDYIAKPLPLAGIIKTLKNASAYVKNKK